MKILSVEEVEAARVKVLENARELVEDAELLLDSGRFPRAYGIAHLACEEMAKIPMLVRAATDTLRGEEFDWAHLGRRLRSHVAKTRAILLTDYMVDPDMDGDADLKRLREDLERLSQYNQLKNWSLYTDFSGGSCHKPSEVISESLATSLVELARGRLTFFETVELPTQGKIEEIVEMTEFKEFWKQFEEP